MKRRNKGIIELKLLSVTIGLARDAISSSCITCQYLILRRIEMGTYTLGPPTGHPRLDLQLTGRFRQNRPQFSGQSVHSSGFQTGLSQLFCSRFASPHRCIRQPSAERHQHNRQRSSGRIRCSQNQSALMSRYIRQPCSVLHQCSHWQFSWSNRYIRQLYSVHNRCSHQ